MQSSSNISALKLAVVAIGMLGFGYALVPLYNVICDITGLNGRSETVTQQQNATFETDTSRTITVEFITSLNQGMAWDFKPEIRKMQVHPGQAYQANFSVSNNSSNTMIGQAIPSVAPFSAASHFIKTECFCFNNQMLKAGESMQMPVVFVINPDLPDRVKTVTLSYTFFDISNSASQDHQTDILQSNT